MNIGIVRMGVLDLLVPMRMGVRLARWVFSSMLVSWWSSYPFTHAVTVLLWVHGLQAGFDVI